MAKKYDKKKYAIILLTVTVIFLAGLLIGSYITQVRLERYSSIQNKLRLDLFSLELQEKIIKQNICDAYINGIVQDKTKLGQSIEFLEQKLGKNNPMVVDMKREYTLYSIRQWLMMRQINEQCNKNLTIIMFFYSNTENATGSEQQGYVLDYLYRKYPDTINTYAFDVNIDDRALDSIKEIYGIRVIPTVVVGEEKLEGFQSRDVLEPLVIHSK